MSVIVYGASDDLIELEGEIREEFSAYNGGRLAFSNGVLLDLEYDRNGTWRITALAGRELVAHFPARGEDEGNDEDGCPGYSEKAYVTGPIEWVMFASEDQNLVRA